MPDFTGHIAVAVNIVSGPGSLSLSSQERDSLIEDALAGLDFLDGLETRADVTYSCDIEEIELTKSSPIWVKNISDEWNGWPTSWSGVDAVTRHPNGKMYFFRGDEYARYTPGTGFDSGYPKKTSAAWDGWPATWHLLGIDAAVQHPNGNIYFFKGDEYLKHVPGEGVDTSAYPKKIASTWANWPSSWTHVDAAVFPQNGSDNRLYFFRGDEYLRYITGGGDGGGVSEDFPKKIFQGKKGDIPFMPSGFHANIGAAVGFDDGRLYFFSGSQYCRYPGFGYEAFEKHWRNPVNSQLGFSDVSDYADSLQQKYGADAAIVTYITSYPLWWWGYASGKRHVIHTKVQTWDSSGGTDDLLPAVYAHETLHLFGAPDEYNDGPCSDLHGSLAAPNRNSTACPGDQLPCLMDNNDAELCAWSRHHVGWNYGLDQVDAAIEVDPDRMYFFGNNRYVRFDPNGRGQARPGYPRTTSNVWDGWPDGWNNVDAVVSHPNGKLYFFRGADYIRYTVGEGVDTGYPKDIAAAWGGWPVLWHTVGIDAAVQHPNGNIYFFKGDEYLKHVPGEGVDTSAYPKKIASTWANWPSSWTHVDAALHRSGNNKLYFFRGDRYIRYTPGEGVDSGYPRRIRSWWGGLLKR